jgi:hypothetical protein
MSLPPADIALVLRAIIAALPPEQRQAVQSHLLEAFDADTRSERMAMEDITAHPDRYGRASVAEAERKLMVLEERRAALLELVATYQGQGLP